MRRFRSTLSFDLMTSRPSCCLKCFPDTNREECDIQFLFLSASGNAYGRLQQSSSVNWFFRFWVAGPMAMMFIRSYLLITKVICREPYGAVLMLMHRQGIEPSPLVYEAECSTTHVLNNIVNSLNIVSRAGPSVVECLSLPRMAWFDYRSAYLIGDHPMVKRGWLSYYLHEDSARNTI